MTQINRNFDQIEPIIRSLPEKPGIYQYFDENGKILYVGKAKNLKKRVASYFTKDHSLSGRLRVLVKKIADIRTIVVETEMDALLLENNLIKKHQPRYNVQLKDDKSYPWICIKNERFPRVFPTRNVVDDGSEYFGPYASVRMMNTLLDLIKRLYTRRTCNFNLTPQNIEKGKFKVCLEYHIGNCKGPCEGLQSEEDYNRDIAEIRQIIKGNVNVVKKELRQLMEKYAAEYAFEQAQEVKERIELLERYQSKSTIVNPKINNVDVFAIVPEEKSAFVNFLKVVNGAIIQSHTIELKKKLDERPAQLLTLAITDFRQRFNSDSKEIIVNLEPDTELPGLEVTLPKIGDKKKLVDLSERNATYFKMEQDKQKTLVDPERHTRRILKTMKNDLQMQEEPSHIEAFDNSNTQGSYPVAAMVVFKNAKPDKKEYRHFNVKTVEGPNDYASMEEIVYRRYSRLLKEDKALPQLIVIDGGKGQLSAAVKSLEELGLRHKITIIGIAKRLEEIYFPEDPVPLYIDKKSETLRVIQHIRDEAHRFGITHHRKRREKGTIKTELTQIKGIGEATANDLLNKFRSVKRIKEASIGELEKEIGPAKARLVFDHFQRK
ncbi:MAG: excinuclease ABC subunit UvrC [Bacteroidales bacterium]|nr:excinuclease ABC subunit UvrC [Bacteroidales bacterium]